MNTAQIQAALDASARALAASQANLNRLETRIGIALGHRDFTTARMWIDVWDGARKNIASDLEDQRSLLMLLVQTVETESLKEVARS